MAAKKQSQSKTKTQDVQDQPEPTLEAHPESKPERRGRPPKEQSDRRTSAGITLSPEQWERLEGYRQRFPIPPTTSALVGWLIDHSGELIDSVVGPKR